jgi:hypothetical protein
MALSRKRRKELARLKNQAENLWDDQKELLEHASRVVRDASRQAANFAREDVAPRVRDTYEDRVRPAVASGIAGARSAANSTREKLVGEVLPGLTSALGTALAAIEVAKNQQVREAISRATKMGTDLGVKAGIIQPKSSGVGKYVLIGLGVVAAGVVAYAAWQTLRADDDLWIEDEPETLDVTAAP